MVDSHTTAGFDEIGKGHINEGSRLCIVLHRKASFPGYVKRFVVLQTFTTWLGNKANMGSYTHYIHKIHFSFVGQTENGPGHTKLHDSIIQYV